MPSMPAVAKLLVCYLASIQTSVFTKGLRVLGNVYSKPNTDNTGKLSCWGDIGKYNPMRLFAKYHFYCI